MKLSLRIVAILVLAGRLGAPSAALSAQSSSSAPLRAGDRLVVYNPTEASRREEFDVDPSGRVALPRIGELNVSAIAASALGDSIRARYRQLQRVDDVYVQALRRISILGEVRVPGLYFLDATVNLRDAVAKAGGVNDNGNPCCLMLLRDGGRRRMVEWMEMPSSELELRSGDILIIERELWIKRNVFSIISGAAVLLSTLVLVTR